MTTRITISGIACQASIGVFAWEKHVRQQLLIDLELEVLAPRAQLTDELTDTVDYKELTTQIIELCRSGHFGLLERLAEELAQVVFAFDQRIVALELTLHKPGALRHAGNVSLTINRQRHQVVIGIGSNIEPEARVEEAVKRLEREFGALVQTDRLTTSAVARPQDADFINTAVLLRTTLDETVLLRRLKHIEYEMGRECGAADAYAPRIIDLDLVLFNDRVVDADLFVRDFLQILVSQLAPGLLEHLYTLYSHTPEQNGDG